MTPLQSVVYRWRFGVLLAWPAMVVPGFVVVERYASAPGRLAEPPATWPASIALDRTPGRDTIVMLAHPRCPCTRSSLRELSHLMTAVDGRADGYVLFVDPAGTSWEHTDLWTLAAEIPGMHVLDDRGGAIASLLGAYTSGQVVVYDAAGTLSFNGGITRARGHEGESIGREAITDIVNGRGAPIASSDVFGCDLQEPERAQ
ncbi:MAG: RedB protein [Myxococcota bacterium]